jgi:predicted unusual protein kinase regulating ubiquinone biosynthesis (AarF/ABC1/UbiB family)
MLYLLYLFWYALVRDYVGVDHILQRYFFSLGGLYVKVAQMLSVVHENSINDDYQYILGRQRRIAPHHCPEIDHDYFDNCLKDVKNPEFVCAGSFAYIYRGTWHGKSVAIKILRPNIQDSLNSTCAWINQLLSIVDFICPSLIAVKRWHTIEQLLTNSCDLNAEAENTRRYQTILRGKYVRVPKIYKHRSDYIIMEFVEGKSISKVKDKLKKSVLTKRLLKSCFNTFFNHGMCPSDIHPDNVLVGKDGNMVMVDFGMLSSFSDEVTEHGCVFLSYFTCKMYKNAYRYFKTNLAYFPETYDAELLKTSWIEIMKEEAVYTNDFSMSSLLLKLSSWGYQHNVIMRPEYTEIWFFLMNFQHTINQLDPNLRFLPLSLRLNSTTKITKKVLGNYVRHIGKN